MADQPRFAGRLRRRFLLGYELALYALLLGMALAVALPAAPAEAGDEPPQCGKTQSSPVVISR